MIEFRPVHTSPFPLHTHFTISGFCAFKCAPGKINVDSYSKISPGRPAKSPLTWSAVQRTVKETNITLHQGGNSDGVPRLPWGFRGEGGEGGSVLLIWCSLGKASIMGDVLRIKLPCCKAAACTRSGCRFMLPPEQNEQRRSHRGFGGNEPFHHIDFLKHLKKSFVSCWHLGLIVTNLPAFRASRLGRSGAVWCPQPYVVWVIDNTCLGVIQTSVCQIRSICQRLRFQRRPVKYVSVESIFCLLYLLTFTVTIGMK